MIHKYRVWYSTIPSRNAYLQIGNIPHRDGILCSTNIMTRINLRTSSTSIIIMIESLKIFTTDNDQNDRLTEK